MADARTVIRPLIMGANVIADLGVSGNPWEVELKMNYSMDLRFNEDNFGTKQLDPAPTPYKFMIENGGKDATTGNIIIDLSES